MNNFHSTIAIVLVLLFACLDSGMCTIPKIVVYNQQPHRTIYIRCSGNKAYEVSKQVLPSSNETVIPLPHGKVWPPVSCVAKLSEVSYREHLLYLSFSRDKTKRCEITPPSKICQFRVLNNSFYRWDEELKSWVVIPPTIWFP